jgi:hypothetical protein
VFIFTPVPIYPQYASSLDGPLVALKCAIASTVSYWPDRGPTPSCTRGGGPEVTLFNSTSCCPGRDPSPSYTSCPLSLSTSNLLITSLWRWRQQCPPKRLKPTFFSTKCRNSDYHYWSQKDNCFLRDFVAYDWILYSWPINDICKWMKCECLWRTHWYVRRWQEVLSEKSYMARN